MHQNSNTWEATTVRGLRLAVAESLGTHARFSIDDKVLEFVEGVADLEDVETLPWNIADCFGTDRNDPEWKRLWGYDAARIDYIIPILEALTFRAVVDHLALRVTRLEERSDSILGKRCRQAGAFRSIESIARMVMPGTRRFGPSSDVAETMGARLPEFWRQVRWRMGGDVPSLPNSDWLQAEFQFWSIASVMFGLLTFAVIDISQCLKDLRPVADLLLGAFGVLVMLLAIGVLVGRFGPSFVGKKRSKQSSAPAGIRTFRDWVYVIAPKG